MPEAKKHEPSEHAFTGKAVPDPANPRPLLRITGYRGASSEAGHVRLYLDAEISSYIDIPEADVVYQLATPAETDPLGAVTLWVKRDAKLSFKTTNQGGAQAMYGYPGAQAGAQTITPGVTPGTQTFTFPPSPIPPFCTPPSPIPVHCTVSPIPVHCTVSPIPWHCPSPIPVHCTVSPIPIHCTVSPLPAFCVSPIPLHCTVTPATPVSPLCTPVSPETPVSPVSPATTPATTPAPFAGAAAFGAAPQAAFGAAPQAFTQTHFTIPFSPLCHSIFVVCLPTPLPWQCPSPHPVFCPPTPLCSIIVGGCPPSLLPALCPSPNPILCQTPVASPNCTPTIQPTLTQTTATTQTLTQTTATTQTTPATSFAGGAPGVGAAPQAAWPTYSYPTWTWTWPPWPTHPTRSIVTVTFTPAQQ